MKSLKTLFLLSFMILVAFCGYSQNYVTIAREGKVFDTPANKYVTLNQKNEEVKVVPGMVFKTTEKKPGWLMIEYSPGLRGYVSEQIIAETLKMPSPGNYAIINMPGKKLNASKQGDEWIGSLEGKSYAGKAFKNVVVFFDDQNKPAFTLVDFGQGPTVASYDNTVTKFF